MTEAPAADPTAVGAPHLGRSITRGMGWSLLNNFLSRAGSFLTGIVMARILVPDDYGVYAVALVVLNVALSVNELGVSVAIVQRRGALDAVAPTVATIAAAVSAAFALAGVLLAGPIAEAFGAAQAAGVVRLMMIGILLDGLAAVPNALITRHFAQRLRLRIDLICFVVGTPLTIGLALAGAGAWALGWGAVTGNVVAAVLAIVWAPARYRPGWDTRIAREVLRFSLPLAASSLALLLVLNAGQVVVGHELGVTELGYYLLAFNLCSWPISVISAALRRVTLAAFARMADVGKECTGFVAVSGLVLAVTVPICVLLAGYAGPVIAVLYGNTWAPAAAALQFLALFSVGRIAVELVYDFLASVGRTIGTLWLYLLWLAALVPSLMVAARLGGIAGVGVAQALVVGVVVLPALTIVIARTGVSLAALARVLALPVLGAGAVVVTVVGVRAVGLPVIAELAVGVVVGLLVYAAVVSPLRRTARQVWSMDGTG